ncbi:MAG: hypothetical protein ABH954_03620, partial [Candidatus Omnitrophota bacterium]
PTLQFINSCSHRYRPQGCGLLSQVRIYIKCGICRNNNSQPISFFVGIDHNKIWKAFGAISTPL